jgi:Family of unknown function (DUF5678)
MLKEEFQYFVDHQEELVKKYSGKFIVLKNKKVIGVYDSHAEAYTETQKSEELGTFLIQHCVSGADSYSQTFHTQAIIHV